MLNFFFIKLYSSKYEWKLSQKLNIEIILYEKLKRVARHRCVLLNVCLSFFFLGRSTCMITIIAAITSANLYGPRLTVCSAVHEAGIERKREKKSEIVLIRIGFLAINKWIRTRFFESDEMPTLARKNLFVYYVGLILDLTL